jgi:SAM-dependent methyltransferase
MSVLHFVDYPPQDQDVLDLAQPLRGWVSSTRPIVRLEVRADGFADTAVRLSERPDVEKANAAAYRHHAGFASSLTIGQFLRGREQMRLAIVVHTNAGPPDEIPLDLVHVPLPVRKQRKFERFRDRLACPECLAPLDYAAPVFQCRRCRSAYRHNGNSADFLTADFKREFSIVPTENVSSWGYDPKILEILEADPGGLYLDCGAGCRGKYYDNVINFEIVDYPSTDVLGVGEKLPFADGSVDGVFSVAVLEHVKDPFRCAREIMRVIRPGGRLFCVAGFLSPVHAYPHHYYNMTSLGLQNLFPGFEVEETSVPLAVHACTSLAWFLRSYAAGLPPSRRRTFMKLTVNDLIELASREHLHRDPLVQELGREANFELAMATALLARKKPDRRD